MWFGNHGTSDIDQPHLVRTGIVAKQCEGLVDSNAPQLAERALGLLDDDAAVEGALKLLGQGLGTRAASGGSPPRRGLRAAGGCLRR